MSRAPTFDEAIAFDLNGMVVENITIRSFVLPGDRFFKIRFLPGAVDTLAALKRAYPKLYIVTRCVPWLRPISRLHLRCRRFYKRTGIQYRDVIYCSGRGSKAPICERLGITRFFDDRLEVLASLTSVPHRYLFQGREYEIARQPDYQNKLKTVERLESWREIEVLLLRALE